MKQVAVIRHLIFEDLGILPSILNENGYKITYLEAGIDDIGPAYKAELLIILGGPIGVYDVDRYPLLQEEIKCIRDRVVSSRPILGVCLGAQLIAKALGAVVAPMSYKEIGFYPVLLTDIGEESVLKPLESNSMVLHWHGDMFEIPVGAKRLAETSLCKNQAFTYGNHILGLQFHLEFDWRNFEQWLIGHAFELSKTSINIQMLREQAVLYGPRIAETGTWIINDWLKSLE